MFSVYIFKLASPQNFLLLHLCMCYIHTCIYIGFYGGAAGCDGSVPAAAATKPAGMYLYMYTCISRLNGCMDSVAIWNIPKMA